MKEKLKHRVEKSIDVTFIYEQYYVEINLKIIVITVYYFPNYYIILSKLSVGPFVWENLIEMGFFLLISHLLRWHQMQDVVKNCRCLYVRMYRVSESPRILNENNSARNSYILSQIVNMSKRQGLLLLWTDPLFQ